MTRVAAIGIDNNLASGDTRIGLRPTNNKYPCRIDMIGDILGDIGVILVPAQA